MKKWARVWATIKRFRVLILSVLISVTATVTGLLVARGTVYGTTDMPSTITYGDGFTYKAKGFMSKVSYEYSPVALDEWTDEIPSAPGTYRVRAVTKATFGGKRYGKAQQFTLQPKTVTLSVAQSELVYGNAPTLTGDLIPGDRAVCSQYAYTGIGTDTVTVQAQPQSVRIYAQDGRDVTGCYSVQTLEKNITFTARPITLQVTDATHVYDGTEFFSEEYTVSDGSLAFADEISALFTARVTDYTAQPIENTATFSISNTDGVNVTQYYDITPLSGTLTVEKRPLLIQTKADTKIYDGTPFFAGEDFTSDGLVDGQTIAIKADSANSITKTGSVQNAFTPVITDGAGKDVTDNYEYSFPEDSLLTVTPRELTVTSDSDNKVYDGMPLTCKEFADDGLVGLVEGDNVEATFTGTITNAGTTENGFEVYEIVSADGVNVTDCYEIIPQYGTLEVKRRTVKVVTSDIVEVYDGKYHYEQSDNDDYSALIQVDEANGCYALVEGHKLTAEKLPSMKDVKWIEGENGKEVGTVENKIDFLINKDKGITKNYDIQCTYGKLKITPRPITVKSPDLHKVYDGEPLTGEEKNVLSGESPYGYADGQEGIAIDWGSQTEANADYREIKQDLKNNTFVLRIKIKGTETYTTDNYAITYHYGSLTVQKCPITITAKSDEVVYNGEWQEIKAGTLETIENLVSGHTPSGVITLGAKGMNAGDYTHTFDCSEDDVYIKDGNKDVTRNYQITFKEGTLKIAQREITVTSKNDNKVYDGTPLTCEDFADNGLVGLVKGDKVEATFTGTITNAGKADNLFTVDKIVSETLGDVTKNYVITPVYGTLEVTRRPITVKSLDKDEVYNGEPHTRNKWVVSEESPYDFVDGQDGVAIGSAWGSQTNANAEFDKEIEYDLKNNYFEIIVEITATDEDVTSNYDIKYEYGSLIVRKRPIHVTTRSYAWVYDGKSHGDEGIYRNDDLTYDTINSYPLVVEHELYALTFTTVRFWIDTKDGGKDNVLTFMVENEEINKNYTITIKGYGKLTIEKRPIYIQGTHDCTWTYDGEEHYDGDAQSAPYGNDDLWKGGDKDYTILALNDSLVIATPENARPSVTYVWENGIENILTFTVEDGQGDYTGDNYADNYDIRQPDPYTYGTLTIIPRPIYIQGTHDCTWVYDGEAHYDGDGKGNTKGYGNGDLTDEGYKLVSGDTLIIATPTDERPSVIYVWDSGMTNELTFTVQAGKYRGDEDYARNYEIHGPADYGTLTIDPRAITVTTGSASKIYDGTPLVKDESEYQIEGDGVGLLESLGHTIVINVTGTRTDVGESENTCEVTIFDENSVNVSDNYAIADGLTLGKLRVTGKLTIGIEELKKYYDGKPLGYTSDSWWIVEEESNLPDGWKVDFNIAGVSMTNAGVLTDDLTKLLTIKDGNGNIVVDDGENFTVTITGEPLRIEKRKITLTAKTIAKVFDGEELTGGNTADITFGTLAAGHRLQVVTQGEQLYPGSSENVIIEYKILDAGGNDVTDNYEVDCRPGILTVLEDE